MILELLISLAFTSTLEKKYVADLYWVRPCMCLKLQDSMYYCSDLTNYYIEPFFLAEPYRVFNTSAEGVEYIKNKIKREKEWLDEIRIEVLKEY